MQENEEERNQHPKGGTGEGRERGETFETITKGIKKRGKIYIPEEIEVIPTNREGEMEDKEQGRGRRK